MSKSQERQKKLVTLHDWCRALSSLILEEGSGEASADDEALRLGIDSVLSSGDLRGLEVVARDLHEWASGLSPAKRARIDRGLRARFGRGLAEEAEDLARAVRAILREVASSPRRSTVCSRDVPSRSTAIPRGQTSWLRSGGFSRAT